MTTKEQGIIGEAQVLAKFQSLNIPVSIPFGDNQPYDLIIDVKGKLYKIQVKTSSQTDNGKTTFRLQKVRVNQSKNTVSYYKESEIDYYALYSIVRNKIFLIPFSESYNSCITIRYEENKYSNGNQFDVKYEDDYTVEKVLKL